MSKVSSNQSDQLRSEILLLEKVMRIILIPTQQSSSSFQYLPDTSSELSRLSVSSISQNKTILDSLVMERFSVPGTPILPYASESYAAIRDELGKGWSVRTQNAKDMLEYLQESIVSYAALSISQEDMFPQQAPITDLIGLEAGAFRFLEFIERGCPVEFLNNLANYWNREDSEFYHTLIISCILKIRTQVAGLSLLDDPEAQLKTLLSVLSLPEALKIFLETDWIVGTTGEQFESNSSLGIYFSPNFLPLPGSMRKIPGLPPPPDRLRDTISEEFEKIRTRSEYEATLRKYHSVSHSYSASLTALLKMIIKANKEKGLTWLAACINFNKDKLKLVNRLERAKQPVTSSDSFCMNVLDTLLELCKPFMNPDEPMAMRIDPSYLWISDRLALDEETPICTLRDISRPNRSDLTNYGTITEFYFMCLEMWRLGYHSVRENYMDLMRMMNQLKNSPHPAAQNEFKYYVKIRICYDTLLLDSTRNLQLLQLCVLTAALFQRWVNFNGVLPLQTTEILRLLPEHLINDITEFITLLCEMSPETVNMLDPGQVNTLLNFFTIILATHQQVSNPYVKANVVQAISMMVTTKTGEIRSCLLHNDIARLYFLPALVVFYVDIEFSGGAHQFYDKFRYRHLAAAIFNYLWSHEHYQHQTRAEQHGVYFSRFINMLINDTTWCLDEGLAKLTSIKKYEDKLRTAQPTEEEVKNHDQESNYSKYVLQQANESISMLEQVAQWNSSLFVNEEFGNRMGEFLNFFLDRLCGANSLQVKVEDPKSYNFKPEELLADILKLYLHLGKHENFYDCVVRDKRSYKNETMRRGLSICYRKPILSYVQVQELEAFVKKVKEINQKSEDFEMNLGEVPEEFCDPISCEMMRNPVKLPSGYIIDRSTIARHLLSDQNDPFTRAPLTLDMLEDDLELKARIEEWIRSR